MMYLTRIHIGGKRVRKSGSLSYTANDSKSLSSLMINKKYETKDLNAFNKSIIKAKLSSIYEDVNDLFYFIENTNSLEESYLDYLEVLEDCDDYYARYRNPKKEIYLSHNLFKKRKNRCLH